LLATGHEKKNILLPLFGPFSVVMRPQPSFEAEPFAFFFSLLLHFLFHLVSRLGNMAVTSAHVSVEKKKKKKKKKTRRRKSQKESSAKWARHRGATNVRFLNHCPISERASGRKKGVIEKKRRARQVIQHDR